MSGQNLSKRCCKFRTSMLQRIHCQHLFTCNDAKTIRQNLSSLKKIHTLASTSMYKERTVLMIIEEHDRFEHMIIWFLSSAHKKGIKFSQGYLPMFTCTSSSTLT
uniref:Uncharacterized protein n=1 Tax=Arundo donax TaxID=35708 RepID=A0A0A9DEJ0_ARUDO